MKTELRDSGLYANEDGSVVVCLHRVTRGEALYETNLPKYIHTQKCDYRWFCKSYPIKVTGVEVEEGATRATRVEGGKLYTDGKRILRVEDLPVLKSYAYLSVQMLHPYTGQPARVSRTNFLSWYPWHLGISCVEIEK